MGQNEVLTGMVLNVMPIGECDKRVTVLTKEKGKITAFAKGARRPTSQLLAAASPFSFGEFELFMGRSTYQLVKASISNYFRELSQDPTTACYGFYFLEIADFYAQEHNDEKELLKLLYQTLRALGRGSISPRLIRRVFELRTLSVEGECPDFFACRLCGAKEGLSWFSSARHGMACNACARENGFVPVEESALYAMQYIVSSKLSKLYTFTVSEEVLTTVERVLDLIFPAGISHEFHSLEILKAIAG